MTRVAAGASAMRLERTAREAATSGFKAFSTTLSISPWQDHDAIAETGDAAGERHGVEFLYRICALPTRVSLPEPAVGSLSAEVLRMSGLRVGAFP